MDKSKEYRRRHVRYPGFQAEVILGNTAYGVRDWSLRGACFETAPDARLAAGDHVQVILKFRFPHDTITIRQQARILRAARRGVAVEFPPPPPETRRQFERVLDSMHARSFLESQVA